MSTSKPNDIRMEVKLVIDKKRQIVLFAEADKQFVDFLMSLALSLPNDTITRLLSVNNKLYRSIQNLRNVYTYPRIVYTIMDDLEVKTTVNSFTLLYQLNTDINAVKGKTVSLGVDEGLKLLNASLDSNNVLTNVLLKKGAA